MHLNTRYYRWDRFILHKVLHISGCGIFACGIHCQWQIRKMSGFNELNSFQQKYVEFKTPTDVEIPPIRFYGKGFSPCAFDPFCVPLSHPGLLLETVIMIRESVPFTTY